MDALIDRYAVHLLDGAQEIAEEKSIPVVERIIRVVMALNLSGGSKEGNYGAYSQTAECAHASKIQRSSSTAFRRS